tara:strand:- start:293 stop:616 length:324 start_codon:yes stop_codon:yes gene_type:complete
MNWFGLLKIDPKATSIIYTLLTSGNQASKAFLSPIVDISVQKIMEGKSDKEIVNNMVNFILPELVATFDPVMDASERFDFAISHIDYEKLRPAILNIIQQIRQQVEQ